MSISAPATVEASAKDETPQNQWNRSTIMGVNIKEHAESARTKREEPDHMESLERGDLLRLLHSQIKEQSSRMKTLEAELAELRTSSSKTTESIANQGTNASPDTYPRFDSASTLMHNQLDVVKRSRSATEEAATGDNPQRTFENPDKSPTSVKDIKITESRPQVNVNHWDQAEQSEKKLQPRGYTQGPQTIAVSSYSPPLSYRSKLQSEDVSGSPEEFGERQPRSREANYPDSNGYRQASPEPEQLRKRGFSALFHRVNPTFTIHVQSPVDRSTFKATALNTIADLKDGLAGTSVYIRDFNGRVLFQNLEQENKSTFGSLGVKDGDVFEVAPDPAKVVDGRQVVFVSLPGRERLTFEVKPRETLRELKSRIMNLRGYSITGQRLFFEGKEQTNNLALLFDIGIRNQATMHLVTNSAPQISPVQSIDNTIIVKTLTGKSFSFNFDPKSTLLSLKRQIEDKEGIPMGKQRLIFAGKQLDDHHSFEHYNVKGGDTLHLVLRLEVAYMTLTVKTLTGKSFSFNVDPTSTLLSLKRQIEDKEGIPMEKQRLVFTGKQLDDYRSFEYYNVKEGDTVHLVLSL
jgi:ubiquitin C